MNPIQAIGTAFKFSDLENKFPMYVGDKEEEDEKLTLLKSTIDFTFMNYNEKVENVNIEFKHEPFNIPKGFLGRVSNIYIIYVCTKIIFNNYNFIKIIAKRKYILCFLGYGGTSLESRGVPTREI